MVFSLCIIKFKMLNVDGRSTGMNVGESVGEFGLWSRSSFVMHLWLCVLYIYVLIPRCFVCYRDSNELLCIENKERQ